jgi:hypothetical protein
MRLLNFSRIARGLPKNPRKIAAAYGLPVYVVLEYRTASGKNVAKWHAMCRAASNPYHVAPAPKETA